MKLIESPRVSSGRTQTEEGPILMGPYVQTCLIVFFVELGVMGAPWAFLGPHMAPALPYRTPLVGPFGSLQKPLEPRRFCMIFDLLGPPWVPMGVLEGCPWAHVGTHYTPAWGRFCYVGLCFGA